MRTVNLAVTAVLLTTVLYGCSRGDQAPEQVAPAVTVATPLQNEVVDWDEATGRFEAVRTVEVRARVGGYIQSVHFRDGEMVRQGQLLFTLDPRPAQAALATARAQLAQAEAQLTLARTELTRAEGLVGSQAVSQSEVDTRRGAVAQGEAAVASANAAIRAAQLEVEFTRVTAPISGRISARRIDPGNLVAGGSSAGDILTTIVSSSPIYFNFDGSEALALKYQRDQGNRSTPVRIRLQDETAFNHLGELDFSDNAIDPNSGTLRLRALVPNANGFLKPGMYGHAQLAGGSPYQAMMVPDTSIIADGARRVVYVVDAEGKVAAKAVTPGPLVDGLRVIRDGLDAEDRVIINGLQRARPGQAVTAENGEIVPQKSSDNPAPTTAASTASQASVVN